jgi:hypothetical protein
VIIFGNPDYYKKYGFRLAGNTASAPRTAKFHAALLVLPLVPGALDGVCGRFLESEAFETDPDQLEAFERLFPPREKLVTPLPGGNSQDRFHGRGRAVTTGK